MPSRKPGQTERMGNHAGLSTRTKQRGKASAAGNGIRQVARKRKKPEDYELPLKNSGEPMEVRNARAWEDEVRELLEKHPEHFRVLHSLVEGRSHEATEGQLRDLRKWGYLARDRSPLPGARAIIEAAYRQTPDGPAIVDPFDVKTDKDAATFQLAEEQLEKLHEQGLDRLIRILINRDKGDSKGKGHSR